MVGSRGTAWGRLKTSYLFTTRTDCSGVGGPISRENRAKWGRIGVMIEHGRRGVVVLPDLIDDAAEAGEGGDVAGRVEIAELGGRVGFLDDLAQAEILIYLARSIVIHFSRDGIMAHFKPRRV